MQSMRHAQVLIKKPLTRAHARSTPFCEIVQCKRVVIEDSLEYYPDIIDDPTRRSQTLTRLDFNAYIVSFEAEKPLKHLCSALLGASSLKAYISISTDFVAVLLRRK